MKGISASTRLRVALTFTFALIALGCRRSRAPREALHEPKQQANEVAPSVTATTCSRHRAAPLEPRWTKLEDVLEPANTFTSLAFSPESSSSNLVASCGRSRRDEMTSSAAIGSPGPPMVVNW